MANAELDLYLALPSFACPEARVLKAYTKDIVSEQQLTFFNAVNLSFLERFAQHILGKRQEDAGGPNPLDWQAEMEAFCYYAQHVSKSKTRSWQKHGLAEHAWLEPMFCERTQKFLKSQVRLFSLWLKLLHGCRARCKSEGKLEDWRAYQAFMQCCAQRQYELCLETLSEHQASAETALKTCLAELARAQVQAEGFGSLQAQQCALDAQLAQKGLRWLKVHQRYLSTYFHLWQAEQQSQVDELAGVHRLSSQTHWLLMQMQRRTKQQWRARLSLQQRPFQPFWQLHSGPMFAAGLAGVWGLATHFALARYFPALTSMGMSEFWLQGGLQLALLTTLAYVLKDRIKDTTKLYMKDKTKRFFGKKVLSVDFGLERNHNVGQSRVEWEVVSTDTLPSELRKRIVGSLGEQPRWVLRYRHDFRIRMPARWAMFSMVRLHTRCDVSKLSSAVLKALSGATKAPSGSAEQAPVPLPMVCLGVSRSFGAQELDAKPCLVRHESLLGGV